MIQLAGRRASTITAKASTAGSAIQSFDFAGTAETARFMETRLQPVRNTTAAFTMPGAPALSIVAASTRMPFC